jgi:GNAT superfamily N-acetyltransferase
MCNHPNMKDLEFTPFAAHPPGTLCSLLSRSYEGYFAFDPDARDEWHEDWRGFDQFVFENLDTVGKCGFVSVLNGTAVGFSSWDPRGFPLAIIGHNCVDPKHGGAGFGRAQILETLRILKAQGFTRARVTTGDHPFFIPAQKMYQACGFKEAQRNPATVKTRVPTIDYEILL